MSVAETSVQEIEAGEGETTTAEQDVELRYLAVNGTTGEEILSTFPTDETVVMSLSNPNLLPGFLNGLVGTKPGQSMILAMSPQDAFGAAGNAQLGIGPNDTVIFYVEVVKATTPLTQAEGEAVEPVEGLPTVEADGTSPATITIPEGEEPPSELVVQPLIKGEGAEIQAGQQVRMQYTGVQWSDGELFDTSLQEGREAFETVIGAGQVIQGWDEGLVGQTVGSRVLLVIPPAMGYGAAQEDGPGYELKDETLVFVVDILAAQ
nr:FKBP-type peptidyl-prolyl cis-trans isomerase [Ornithinimicrobium cryptoxanthini]